MRLFLDWAAASCSSLEDIMKRPRAVLGRASKLIYGCGCSCALPDAVVPISGCSCAKFPADSVSVNTALSRAP